MKTYEEIVKFSRQAISELKAPSCDGTYDDDPRELIRDSIKYHALVAKACAKQIREKPTYNTDKWTGKPRCGKCNRHIKGGYMVNYCQSCGTKIDWRVE